MFAFPDNAAPIKAADCGTSQQNVPDQTVLVLAGTPATAGNGMALLHNKELIVMERADEYLFLFPDQPLLVEARLKKDASFSVFTASLRKKALCRMFFSMFSGWAFYT